MSIRIIAGVVTFNPEYERLLQNLTELAKQVEKIIIVDNGSNNIKHIVDSLPNNLKKQLIFLYNEKNMGIAQALSRIMMVAQENKYDWVITLDQDSIIEPTLVQKYCDEAIRKENFDVAMFTCLIKDRNFKDEKYEIQNEKIIDVSYCITSAAFTNVKKYYETCGYDDKFFIDCVDFDICYSLREKGYRISRINFIGLYHEVGQGENRRFIGKEIVIYHHAPFRIYYLARNTVWMHRKHRKMFPMIVMIKKLLALWLRIMLYEDDRINKLKSFYNGLKDSMKRGEN